MEVDLEPRAKPLGFKVKAASRESPTQKAANVLDSDLKTYWSTGTNTKEWILLQLDEPCLLSHIRIYNKSVLEWEITVGLQYKPETFVKVRPRCDAPKRDMMYLTNYTPCRYVRISCLRGNPIAIFFLQLIGVSVPGLEPEFQPIVNYLLPDIISRKLDPQDIYLQLLRDVTSRLGAFLPQLEKDLSTFSESSESKMRFFAMLVGPLYPILCTVNDREKERASPILSDSDMSKTKATHNITISSNFQPRRSWSPSPLLASSSIAFQLETVFMLLRKACKDSHLGTVCRTASRALQKLAGSSTLSVGSMAEGDLVPLHDVDDGKTKAFHPFDLSDYSNLFGEEFRIHDDKWDISCANLLDIAVVEEGILHVLYACASQPHLCCKLADSNSNFWAILPLMQALLPALRPLVGSPPDQIDESFSQWNHSFCQQALAQIAASSSSSVLCTLLQASSGYLLSYSESHIKTASVLLDLCSGALAPWIPTIIKKVDLAIELLEDLLAAIQQAHQYACHARAALKYIIIALSGQIDDILPKFKEFKHKLLFLVEMLEPFLDPAVTSSKNIIAFGDVSPILFKKQQETCKMVLNVIRAAVQKPAVLPSLESEWRRGSVVPSVLLSMLGPDLPLPPEIDDCKCSVSKIIDQKSTIGSSSKFSSLNESDERSDSIEAIVRMDRYADAGLLFAPPELKNMILCTSNVLGRTSLDGLSTESSGESTSNRVQGDNFLVENIQYSLTSNKVPSADFFNLQADYLQLCDLEDCKSRASAFQQLALDLHSQQEVTAEGHEAAIEALLLAAECYINPFFMISFRNSSKLPSQAKSGGFLPKTCQKDEIVRLAQDFKKIVKDLGTVSYLESKRDKIVLEILLQAAELDKQYYKITDEEYPDQVIKREKPFEIDMQAADAVTLLRENQAVLCHFMTQRLPREQQSLHEVLLQSLLFYLHSATQLFCSPETVIDIIIQSAEYLNTSITSFYRQLGDCNGKVDIAKLHGIKRHRKLLQNLVSAAAGCDDELESRPLGCGGLIPLTSWVSRIPSFSISTYPIVRFLGWMAVSRYAKQQLAESLCFRVDLSQVTLLLSIFMDELIDNIVDQDDKCSKFEIPAVKHLDKESGCNDHPNWLNSFRILHPDLHKFFPDMKNEMIIFGEIILEAIVLQLKSIPAVSVPDALCWLSELCLSPVLDRDREKVAVVDSVNRRGHPAKSAKAIILCLLEAVVSEHMEAMVPELPRLSQILVSLCKASYSDVAFIDSVLRVVKPLISYGLVGVLDGESQLIDDTLHDYEVLCFEELFNALGSRKFSDDRSGERKCQGPLVIFTLGKLFPELSLKRKLEIVQSLSYWTEFSSFESTSSYFDYLSAFQCVADSCIEWLIVSLEALGIENPDQKQQQDMKIIRCPEESLNGPGDLDIEPQSVATKESKDPCNSNEISSCKRLNLSTKHVEEISKSLDELFSKLYPAIEHCWELHSQLTLKLTIASAKCCMYLRCLTYVVNLDVHDIGDTDSGVIHPLTTDVESKHWRASLEGLTTAVIATQQNHCWRVASSMLDYLLGLPEVFSLDCVTSSLCSVIKNFSYHAPQISWRVQTEKWLSSLFTKGNCSLNGDKITVSDLLCTLLGHPEPEQRSIALQHLGRLVGLDINNRVTKLSYIVHQDFLHDSNAVSTSEGTICDLVSSTWSRVAFMALSDPSLPLRANAMALLSGYVPFAGRNQLQSFLVSADTIFHSIGTHLFPTQGPLWGLSLSLLASACLYSPPEDISLIPDSVWRKLESVMESGSGRGILEQKLCRTLCELRNAGGNGKEALKEIFSSSDAANRHDPNFRSTRESILQVLTSLNSAKGYFEFFSTKIDKEYQELEEAEIEKELLQKEKSLEDSSERSVGTEHPLQIMPHHSDVNSRLSQVKNEIRELERSKLKEEILARRQKKLILKRERQKYLEEATLREMELLQELDRERISEMEKEIERQKLLELERAKTRELRCNLDLEKERQTQRELLREIEHIESGVQASRREFSTSSSSRPRERYRDRDNGRSVNEGNIRSSSRGRESGPMSGGVVSGGTGVMLAGSRSFSGQPPTILQSRDRSNEPTASYEDSVDGSRDSGDTGSVGDPDTGLGFDGMAAGIGSTTRQGSRGGRSRQQIVDRRERDARREGKWERKHS